MMDALTYLHGSLAIAGMISIICRLKTMSRSTKLVVRTQHAILFAGLLWSLIVPPKYAALPVLAGIVVFLLLSAGRWRDGPPPGTTLPGGLDPLQPMEWKR